MLTVRERRPMGRRSMISELERIHNLVENLMGEIFGSMTPSTTSTTTPSTWTWIPPMNMWVENNTLHCELFVPGISKDQLEVNVTEDTLTIRGNYKSPWSEGNMPTFYLYEYPFGSFYRQVSLPFPVNTQNVQAKYENGVLRITMPLTTSNPQGHRVQIS
ncbi:MAG: Hsp20/alpha crystallin family protein [Candidatus Calescibacterium sp.]|nr:Hsp20/alpha crystallin family protein [Candidatus Calescibacterium sp.]MCX7972045.1 Hsp20/alpha crystallin family protein [bacterium]MDW8194671.1 Hsp20/alpha crystallin family protein [Candidatus Calescibacterium sp.]